MSNQMGRRKNALFNIIFSLILQLITVISGLILPKIRIEAYGSDVNGLISSITQFLSYITLLEGGIGGVVNAALYGPLAKKDFFGVSEIVSTAKNFYKKIAYVFLGYVFLLCFIYPTFIKSNFETWYIICFIIILSVGTCLRYFFSLSYSSLLTADQKGRINSIIIAVTTVINMVAVYVAIKLNASALTVQILSCIIFAIRPLFYVIYIKKNYPLVKAKPNGNCISQKWSGFAHHIAFFIHNNTDVVLITLFMPIEYASVYAIYLAIISGLKLIITSISSGSVAGFGNLLAIGDKESTNRVVDSFEFLQFALTTVVYTICAVMIMPFMKIYTAGINDADYIQPLFAYLLIIAEAFFCLRLIYSTLTNAAGHFKGTWPGAALESGLNILISVSLVHKIGLVGIALGTAAGMLARLLYEVIYLSKNIIFRSVLKFLKAVVVNVLISAIVILICETFPPLAELSLLVWTIRAIIVGLITISVAVVIYLVFYKNSMLNIFKTALSILPKKRQR